MRRYFLLIILLITASCSRPDFDTSAQVQTWLESLDPNDKVIQVTCTADIDKGGKWVTEKLIDQLSPGEVLAGSGNRGLEWPDIVSRTAEVYEKGFADFYLLHKKKTGELTWETAKTYILKYKNARCASKALLWPPIQIGKCPNSTDGCDDSPNPTDPPPLPPPPPPGGGGDFF